MDKQDGYFSIKDIMEYYSISKSTAYRWVEDFKSCIEKNPDRYEQSSYLKNKRTLRVRISEFKDYVEQVAAFGENTKYWTDYIRKTS